MSIADILIIPAVIVAIALAMPAIWSTASVYIPSLRDTSFSTGTPRDILNATEALATNFDNIFLMVVIGMSLAVVIGAYYLDSHPVFFFASFIIWLISMMLAPMYSNVYNSYINTISGWNAATKLPLTTFIMQNYPLYMLGIGAIITLALYAKFSRGKE